MSVVGKFFVSEIVTHEGSPTADRVKLGAVCRGAQNAKWASATPWGTIEMGVLNDAATGYFEKGAEYEVTFTRVAKPEPHDGHEPQPEYTGWMDRSKPANMCGFCGMYATTAEDGSLDWSAHQEHYGA